EALRSSGGDRLETALRELRNVDQRLVDVERTRNRLDRALEDIGATVSTADDFAALVETARGRMADAEARRSAQKRVAEAMADRRQAETEWAELRAGRRAVESGRGNIPAELQAARAALAEAAACTTDELPSVGELIEVTTES